MKNKVDRMSLIFTFHGLNDADLHLIKYKKNNESPEIYLTILFHSIKGPINEMYEKYFERLDILKGLILWQ